jgi:transposase InsO family protein
LWQTDFTYLKVIGWGWFYLSSVLDGFSRYIVAWKLCTTMKAEDVTATLDLAPQISGLDQANPMQYPRLLSDNCSSYIAGDLAKWLGARNIKDLRSTPYHPMTQGKIERWHQTLKNRILLENFFLPGDLEAQIAAFVDDYNHRRYRENIDNLYPSRRLLRARPNHSGRTRKDQTTDHCSPSPAAPAAGRLISPNRCARASLILAGPLLNNSDDGHCCNRRRRALKTED